MPLVAGMTAIGDLRPGSLTLTYIKCGKPNCCRSQGGDHRHGPLPIPSAAKPTLARSSRAHWHTRAPRSPSAGACASWSRS